MSKKTILVVENHPLYRNPLTNLVKAGFPNATVKRVASSIEVLSTLSKLTKKEMANWVILLDLALPGLSELSAIYAFTEASPNTHIAVISSSNDKSQVSACIGSGAIAFVSKSARPDQLIEFIGRMLIEKPAHQELITGEGNEDISNLRPIRLTPRQIEVLLLIFEGKSNGAIADKLNIIEATAKAHVSAIFRELNVVNRTQALLAAQRLGFRTSSSL